MSEPVPNQLSAWVAHCSSSASNDSFLLQLHAVPGASCYASRVASFIFDSHNFFKRLIASGFSPEQAETIVETARDAAAQFATKRDLQLLEQRIVIKFGCMLVFAVGAIAALIKLL
jgi:hypothetical protein